MQRKDVHTGDKYDRKEHMESDRILNEKSGFFFQEEHSLLCVGDAMSAMINSEVGRK